MEEILNQTYRTPKLPGSFGGINALQRALKGRVKRKQIKNWLQTKDSYTLHKPLRHKFQRNRVIVGGLNDQFQSDLVDMQSLAPHNDGYKYLLTCIDILSKYAWAIPLLDKKSTTIMRAFEKIFLERTPQSLQTDSGKEFTNKLVQNFLKKKKVHFFTTHNSTKASIVERFNRTLKTKMWKYFTEINTKRYIDVIDQLMHSYNHTWHRSIKTEPSSVTLQNEGKVWDTLYGQQSVVKQSSSELKVDDTVRISREKMHFEKGYEQNWTKEIFNIDKIIHRIPVVYKLKDLAGEVIQGSFYKEELQKVSDSGFYPVEKVLKKRKRHGKIEYFVKFQGYPEKFNAWVENVKMIEIELSPYLPSHFHCTMSFYITLPSDSSIEFYPGNTMSHFYTKLPKRLELSGEWEVGLVEMIYPRMWNNIIDGENSFEYDLGNGVKVNGKIVCGFYDSPIDILNAFPKHIKIQMKYNKHTKKVMVQLTNGATVKLSKGLAENLGFEPNKVIGENFIPGNGGPDTVITESPFVADPNVDLHLLYVYTDIIQPEFVGGILAPLLRTLTVKGRDGDMIQEQF